MEQETSDGEELSGFGRLAFRQQIVSTLSREMPRFTSDLCGEQIVTTLSAQSGWSLFMEALQNKDPGHNGALQLVGSTKAVSE